jgi:Type IV secretion-system coupling protein DNA-binding domain
MMRHLKITALALTLAGFAAMTGAYQLGFELWPPRAILANGTSAPFRPAEVQACFKARALAWAGDRGSDAFRQACRQQLITYQALGAFDLRTMAVMGGALIGLMALLGFAVAIRSERPSVRVVRGARLHAGATGRKAFARACADECEVHGRGVALVPSIPLSRDRETRHFLILGSVGGGKTQTMLHLIAEAILRRDGVLWWTPRAT